MSNKGGAVTIHIIAGPTASGKSAFAIDLAQQKDGVIINCDSMQVYDALHVLTAQPSANDLELAPHRLYSVLKPGAKCSAGIWQQMAIEEIETAVENGQTPIICGGTGLYIRALMEGLSPIPDIPGYIRDAAVRKQEELGNPGFHEALNKIDPESAARFHPRHTARLIRAWEVFEATGKKLSDWQKEMKNAPPANWNFEVHKIMPGREELYANCDRRFEKMLELGALGEVKDLAAQIEKGLVPGDALITRAHGFTHLNDFLNNRISREKAIELSQNETRQYAKRQVTWFKHQL